MYFYSFFIPSKLIQKAAKVFAINDCKWLILSISIVINNQMMLIEERERKNILSFYQIKPAEISLFLLRKHSTKSMFA